MSNIHQIRKNLCAKFKGFGVELGVCEAEYSTYILSNNEAVTKLYSIDSWRHHGHYVDHNDVSDFEHVCKARYAMDRLTRFGSRSCMIRELSVDASKLFSDKSLDFVYIDAGHSFEDVMADLNAWYGKIKKGGLICGDDYADGSYVHLGRVTEFGVAKAVKEFFHQKGITYVTDPKCIKCSYIPQWWAKVS